MFFFEKIPSLFSSQPKHIYLIFYSDDWAVFFRLLYTCAIVLFIQHFGILDETKSPDHWQSENRKMCVRVAIYIAIIYECAIDAP